MPEGGAIDYDRAAEIAAGRLAADLRSREESHTSNHAQLTDQLNQIKAALEAGEDPERSHIEEALFYLEVVHDDLKDVAELHGWNPWEVGFTWDELSDEQKREVEEDNA